MTTVAEPAGFDTVIRGGLIVDGTGAAPFTGDVAIRHGRIVAVGDVAGSGAEEIDARGRIVTPGFVDIHTHYDGHAIWSERLNPSSFHGVTTVVMGNCGVGFAPCKPQDRERLVSLMEGVEDIPEIVLTEGLTWDWESFPDYLDRLAERRFDMDVAAYLPHAPLRVFVMGQRAVDHEPATADDIARMRAIADEAIAAGAVGFSTSRSLNHKAAEGWVTPSYAAQEAELSGIAGALAKAGHGVLQLISDFDDVEPEFAMLRRVAEGSGRPLSMTVMQSGRAPERWRRIMQLIEAANADGHVVKAQVAPRPVGALLSLQGNRAPFSNCPSWTPIAAMPFAERKAALADPELRSRLIDELRYAKAQGSTAGAWRLDNMYPQIGTPCYEPRPEDSIAGVAARRGVSPEEAAFDLMLEDDGRRMFYMPANNFVDGKVDAVEEMLKHPDSLVGLGDGGAHCSFICDASFPTYLLTRWARSGVLSLADAVRALTSATARAVGLLDRGVIAPGLRADLNVIDLEGLALDLPRIVNDLPGGGGRLRQEAAGYDLTIVAGEVTYRNGAATDALPGRLVRGPGALAA